MFCKKGVLKNFVKFTGKHLCQSLFFNKVAGVTYMLLIFMSKKIVHGKQKQPFFAKEMFFEYFDPIFPRLNLLFTRVAQLRYSSCTQDVN